MVAGLVLIGILGMAGGHWAGCSNGEEGGWTAEGDLGSFALGIFHWPSLLRVPNLQDPLRPDTAQRAGPGPKNPNFMTGGRVHFGEEL